MAASWAFVSVAFLLLVLALTPRAAQALTCSVCNSVFNEDCMTSPQNYVKECVPPPQYNNSDHPPFCRKSTVVVYKYTPEIPLRVSRSCAYLKDPHEDCRGIFPMGMVAEVCQCFTDACNAAPSSFGAGDIWWMWWPAAAVTLALFR
ncbi:uncharacterized protein LOC119432670 [Dermacentor silvarum]|uniref:uncharacterized protein LOC119432670 n=1 Tax=Dermacentor silvarum TaxID=543639 RepID=UPI00189AA451|nr:uncharacterized protein LOC119432670 [Dermacentor silvarum]